MDQLDPSVMQSITNDLTRAKIAADKEIERRMNEENEKQGKLKEKQLKEHEEVESIKIFLQNLAESILGTGQFAEWRNPNEDDRGENYFAIEKDVVDDVRIHLWSDGTGINLSSFELKEVQTPALARMIKSRFDWIAANNVQPIVVSRC